MLFNHSKFLGFSVAKTRQNLNLGVHEIPPREKQSERLSCGHTQEYDNTLKPLQQEEQGDREISWVPVLYMQKDWGSHSKANTTILYPKSTVCRGEGLISCF